LTCKLKWLTQEKFAFKCRLPRISINAIERYRRSISLGNIQKTAYALDIASYKLFIQNDSNDIKSGAYAHLLAKIKNAGITIY